MEDEQANDDDRGEMAGRTPASDTHASQETPAALEEGVDYYLENGLFVFTARYLQRRRYCCESGCHPCPYENQRVLQEDKAR